MMDVELSKENMIVLDGAVQTEILIILQNSWDEVKKHNLQGITL